MIKAGNKGEWSELYVFLKLLSAGRVYAATENLERDTVYYPIVHISREDTGARLFYVIKEKDVTVTDENEQGLISISRITLGDKAAELLNEIGSHNGSFELRNIAEFVSGIRVTRICAPASDKTDINMRIEDRYVNSVQDVGFSIKSELGNAPTLLNAGKTTNFTYAVDGLRPKDISDINNLEGHNKIQSRCRAILQRGGSLRFLEMDNETFRDNLQLIDSKMPCVVAEMLKYHYFENVKTCAELVQLLGERDYLEFKRPVMYDFKVKRLLSAIALGMKPGTEWTGHDEANGGYVVVKVNGEILVYHIYNRNAFEQYLLDRTCLDRGSTTRHEYMSLYEENGLVKIKLNLQIRFWK